MTRLGSNAGGAYTAALHRHPDARALLETPLVRGRTDLEPSARAWFQAREWSCERPRRPG